ncbi:MAG: LptF/LptG family permease [Bacteroidota bacterium]|nr:LptF/LptG family permease [Bacteroidota bacterium]
MKKLNLFIIRSFLGPFIATFFIAIFLLLMQFLWKWVDDLVGKGLEINEIGELLFFASVRFVPLALPISMLLASVMTFGALSEKSELVAMKSAGISLRRILNPLLLFVVFVSSSSFLFSNYVMPIANLKSGSLLYAIQKQKPALNIKEGVFYNGIEGYSIKVEEKNDDGSTLKSIIIYNHTKRNGNDNIIIAESGSMKLTKDERFLEFRLLDGYSYLEEKEKTGIKKKPHRTTKFKENIILFDLSGFDFKRTSTDLYKGHYAMLNNKQLNNAIDSLNIKLDERTAIIKENIVNKYHFNIESPDTAISQQKRDSIFFSQVRVYDYAINKLRTLKSIANANKSDLEYRKYIIRKHNIEWHRKIALAIACIILFLIGAPLGAIIRKGGFGMPVMVSVFFFVFYHVINIIGEKAAKESSLTVVEGMWLANFVFFPIAIILLYNISKENTTFDMTSYTNPFRKRFNKV